MEGFKWLVFIPIGDGLYAMVSDSDFIFLKKIFISQVHSDYDKSLKEFTCTAPWPLQHTTRFLRRQGIHEILEIGIPSSKNN